MRGRLVVIVWLWLLLLLLFLARLPRRLTPGSSGDGFSLGSGDASHSFARRSWLYTIPDEDRSHFATSQP
ncbi:hypothetical protein BDV27DRAFT_130730 [Aspergillus caelatus]|uniref:Uncharacterized protein n=1 Tax=Aspergillus caelatus TaxID=61420 RepID=A0A5N7A370_9EURO|nr:uncharacterized protein BDV27DRAFT_130730 [Aspergillus caelatus]KAE8362940.1 hypothetical protein BDV27DRAFT_130730 [Aspergillus caelatus]